MMHVPSHGDEPRLRLNVEANTLGDACELAEIMRRVPGAIVTIRPVDEGGDPSEPTAPAASQE
jgi:hypothetical protein